jgi:hypothetical protein
VGVDFFFLWPAAVFAVKLRSAEPHQKCPWAGEEKYGITNTPYSPDAQPSRHRDVLILIMMHDREKRIIFLYVHAIP